MKESLRSRIRQDVQLELGRDVPVLPFSVVARLRTDKNFRRAAVAEAVVPLYPPGRAEIVAAVTRARDAHIVAAVRIFGGVPQVGLRKGLDGIRQEAAFPQRLVLCHPCLGAVGIQQHADDFAERIHLDRDIRKVPAAQQPVVHVDDRKARAVVEEVLRGGDAPKVRPAVFEQRTGGIGIRLAEHRDDLRARVARADLAHRIRMELIQRGKEDGQQEHRQQGGRQDRQQDQPVFDPPAARRLRRAPLLPCRE